MLSQSELLFRVRNRIPISDHELISQAAGIRVFLKVAHERAHIHALPFDIQYKITVCHIQNQGFNGMKGVCSKPGFGEGKPGISTIGRKGKPLAPWNIELISPNSLSTVARPAGCAALSFNLTMMS